MYSGNIIDLVLTFIKLSSLLSNNEIMSFFFNAQFNGYTALSFLQVHRYATEKSAYTPLVV